MLSKSSHALPCRLGTKTFAAIALNCVLLIGVVDSAYAIGWITGGDKPKEQKQEQEQNKQQPSAKKSSAQKSKAPELKGPSRGFGSDVVKFQQTKSDSMWRVRTGDTPERALKRVLAEHIKEHSTGIDYLRRAAGVISHCQGMSTDELGLHSLFVRTQGLVNSMQIGYRVPGPIRPQRCSAINKKARDALNYNAFMSATTLAMDEDVMPLGLVGLTLGRMMACGHESLAYESYERFRGIADHNYRIMPERLVAQAESEGFEPHEAARWATVTPSYDPLYFGRGIESGITGMAHDLSQCSLATEKQWTEEFERHISIFRESM